jgi:hypothetical protein
MTKKTKTIDGVALGSRRPDEEPTQPQTNKEGKVL